MNDASVTLSLHWAALIGCGGCVGDAAHTKGIHDDAFVYVLLIKLLIYLYIDGLFCRWVADVVVAALVADFALDVSGSFSGDGLYENGGVFVHHGAFGVERQGGRALQVACFFISGGKVDFQLQGDERFAFAYLGINVVARVNLDFEQDHLPAVLQYFTGSGNGDRVLVIRGRRLQVSPAPAQFPTLVVVHARFAAVDEPYPAACFGEKHIVFVFVKPGAPFGRGRKVCQGVAC